MRDSMSVAVRLGVLAFVVLAGCEAGDETAGEAGVAGDVGARGTAAEAAEPARTGREAAEPARTGREAAEAAVAALPDTTAEAVRAYLEEVGYAEAWRMWPGKVPLYEGGEPHGMLLTTYLNDVAYRALTAGSGPLPDGSMVVKENYRPDSTLAAVTVMYAREGYDPEHDDWFWAKYLPDGSVEAAGRVSGCQECHAAGERGHLRTPYTP